MAYIYLDVEFTRDELEAQVSAEAATLPNETWRDDEFDFGDWLTDALFTGTVTKVESPPKE